MSIYKELAEALAEKKNVALLTIVDTYGCAPRKAGTKMLVYADGKCSGTIGGDAAERTAIGDALKLLENGTPAVKRYSPANLAPGGKCLKDITVLIEPFCFSDKSKGKDKAPSDMELYSKALADVVEWEEQGLPGVVISTIVDGLTAPKMIIDKEGRCGKAPQETPSDQLLTLCRQVMHSNKPLYIQDKGEHKLFIEPLLPAGRLYLLGSGHIAKALLPFALKIGFRVIIADSHDMSGREQELEGAELLQLSSFSELAEKNTAPGGFYLICTGSHAEDGEALEALIDKDTAYIGMLGAKHKFLPIYKHLLAKGIGRARLMEIYAPAGLDLGGDTPEEIALSIISEIMAVKNGRDHCALRDKKQQELFAEL